MSISASKPSPVPGKEGDSVICRAIGRVESDLDLHRSPAHHLEKPAPVETSPPAESRIVVDPALTEGLTGLEPGQRIMVVFSFHRSQGFDLLQHPRGDQSSPRTGVFNLRSPRRPSPIGVTVVELMAIEGNVLRVRDLDAIDGTPVLDLKPAR